MCPASSRPLNRRLLVRLMGLAVAGLLAVGCGEAEQDPSPGPGKPVAPGPRDLTPQPVEPGPRDPAPQPAP